MILLATGDRHYTKKKEVDRVLDRLHRRYGITLLIHGTAVGLDRIAESWALRNQIDYNGRPAKWTRDGNRAGPIRNVLMLAELELLAEARSEDAMVAAWHDSLDWSKGTKHMVEASLKAGLPVLLTANGESKWLSAERPVKIVGT